MILPENLAEAIECSHSVLLEQHLEGPEKSPLLRAAGWTPAAEGILPAAEQSSQTDCTVTAVRAQVTSQISQQKELRPGNREEWLCLQCDLLQ